jgi:NAD(P)H-nitrite reductase large subunit
MTQIEKIKYLIIGNSAGGIGAAEAIREVDKAGQVAMISAETYPAYSRPLISEYLAEKCSLERMLFRPVDFYERNNIQTIFGTLVARLDVPAHIAELSDGRKIAWEKLLLATGGSPIVPPIEDMKKNGVFTFITLDDARAIDQFLSKLPATSVHAVVIGGGLIGVSVTEALVKRQVKVTIVEMKERILNTVLDEEASAIAAKALKQAGVEIITEHTVTRANSYDGDTITGVTLDDGQTIPCELMVLAIGVLPRIELAAGTGIKTNRGIVVDRHMATSCPDVYACGDVAEAYDFVYAGNRLSPIWPNAYLGGRIAGQNMAGMTTEYQGGTAMNSMKYFGMNLVSAGMAIAPIGSEVLTARHGNIYKKVILKDGVIIGLVLCEDTEKSGIIINLMKDKVNVDGFKQVLVGNDFGLTCLPEKLWRQRLPKPPVVTATFSAKETRKEILLIGG